MDTTQINPQPDMPQPATPPARPGRTFSSGFRLFVFGLAILISLSALWGSLLKDHVGEASKKVGIVEVTGIISSSQDIVRQLREFGEDQFRERCKPVYVRVLVLVSVFLLPLKGKRWASHDEVYRLVRQLLEQLTRVTTVGASQSSFVGETLH